MIVKLPRWRSFRKLATVPRVALPQNMPVFFAAGSAAS